jgi:hypothetical protein
MCYMFRPVDTIWIKTDLCCFRLNKCSLFSDKHKGMAYIKIYTVPFPLFIFYYLFVGPTFIFASSVNDKILFPAVHVSSLTFKFSITFCYVFCNFNLQTFLPYSKQFFLLSIKFHAVSFVYFFYFNFCLTKILPFFPSRLCCYI